MMKKSVVLCLLVFISIPIWAVEIRVSDPKSWSSSSLAQYEGQVVSFSVPMYLLTASGSYLSPYCLAGGSDANTVYLSGGPTTNRPRTYSKDLQAKVVDSGGRYSLQYVSGTFDGNTRMNLLKGPDSLQLNKKGAYSLLICAANLEYYLTEGFGNDRGPVDLAEHQKQRAKTKQALTLINADIYGLCEIGRGVGAIQEICNDLNNAHEDRHYVYVNNYTTSSGTYTMSAFIYDDLKVKPIGTCQEATTSPKERKYMQYFKELATDEGFIFSINHFKAKSGGGDTESTRVAEANSVNSLYDSYKLYCQEEDFLIMGDLNAYASEQPVTILLRNGACSDLHQYFHPEGSYSYVYKGDPSYLDHAICNSTLLPQVTGMQAYHVNSDENDCYTYNGGCDDGTMFRYSDHDPILVGLCLNSSKTSDLRVLNYGDNLRIQNGAGGYVRIYDMNGNLLYEHTLDNDDYTIFSDLDVPTMRKGCYVLHVFHNGVNKVTKYIRP